MAENKGIMVSVFMITYNHENYIAQALDGILMQKVNFAYDIVIGEDCSTDRTREIISSYVQIKPELFKLILHDHNVGAVANQNAVLNACRGKYIALCEGDDYWTDPHKLQKQVDFLEKNESYVFCVHRYKRYFYNQKTYADDLFPELFLDSNGIVIDKTIFSKYWLTQPLTALIRMKSLNDILLLANRFNYFRDFHLFYLLLNKGNGFCMNFYGGVYNIHDGGIHSGTPTKKQLIDSFNSVRELYLYCPDTKLELKLINYVLGLIKSKRSLSPLLLIILLDVRFTVKCRIFFRLIKMLMIKIVYLRFCL